MKRPSNRRSAGMTLADLLVIVVMIPLISVLLIGCVHRRGESASRVKCAANLKSIALSMIQYAADNNGAFPRTVYKPSPKVIPTWGTGPDAVDPFKPGGPDPNDVTAALFLLLRTMDITTQSFVCPASNAEAWDYGGGANTAANHSNWPGNDGILKYLSYSIQNPYPDDDAVKRGFKWTPSLGSDFAIAADKNPGMTKDGQNVLKATLSASKIGNSMNHQQDGQNVLYADGHVDFVQTPFAGVNGDNIYARRAGPDGEKSSEVKNSPCDGTDSVLLPTD